MNTNEKEKYYRSYIKSAQSSMAIVVILNIIYIFRFFIKKEFDFFFSLYSTQFALKAGGFFGIYDSILPEIAAVIIVLIVTVLFMVVTGFSTKKKVFLKIGFAAYILDTVFLLWGFIKNPFGDITDASFIDLIFHFLTLVLLGVGIYADEKMKKSD